VTSDISPTASLRAIETGLARVGRGLLIGSSRHEAAEEDACIRRFKAAGVAGLIVAPARHGTGSAELEAWIRSGLPIVLEGHPGPWLLPESLAARCDQIDTDNRGGIRQALEYLRVLRHHRIAYATEVAEKTSERVAAFKESMAEVRDVPPAILCGLTNDRAGGEAAFDKLLGGEPDNRPTAVICSGNDNIALGLIAAAARAGIDCPRDLSVISFSDTRPVEDAAGRARLTTLECPQETMAEVAVRMVLEQVSGSRRRPIFARFPVDLVRRETCGPAPDGPQDRASGEPMAMSETKRGGQRCER
jgi:DNA-binding LacI/PurR family transcriptional regulator